MLDCNIISVQLIILLIPTASTCAVGLTLFAPPLLPQQDLSFDIGEEMQILRPMPVSKCQLSVTRCCCSCSMPLCAGRRQVW